MPDPLPPMTQQRFNELLQNLTSQAWGDALLNLGNLYQKLLDQANQTEPTWQSILDGAGGAGQPDWPSLISGIQAAIAQDNLQGNGDPVSACVYLIDGKPLCAVMTQAQCDALNGHWDDQGSSCPS